MTPKQARKIALSLPEAEEHAHMGHPDFRVRNKIFATLRQNETLAMVKLSLPDQAALLQMYPKAFSLNAWSHQGATDVHLKEIDAALFRQLVEAAWKRVAPKKLVAAYEAGAI